MTEGSKLISFEELQSRLRIPPEYLDELARLYGVLTKKFRCKGERELYCSSFLLPPKGETEVGESLREMASRIQGLAETTYRHTRSTSELVFKSELQYSLSTAHRANLDTLETLAQLVRRMREFWGFESAAVLLTARSANTLSPILYSGLDKETSFRPGEHSAPLNSRPHSFAAQPWLRKPNDVHKERWFNDVAAAFDGFADKLALKGFPGSGWMLFVFIPHVENVYTLVFSKRLITAPFPGLAADSGPVSPGLAGNPGPVSREASHAIVGTSAEILTQLEVAHPTTVAAFNGLEHGLKSGALELLLKVSAITALILAEPPTNETLRRSLAELYIFGRVIMRNAWNYWGGTFTSSSLQITNCTLPTRCT